MPPRRFPPPWSADHSPSTRYCRGGIGVRDDGGAIGVREDGGVVVGVGLRAGAAGGWGGGSGIFTISSATAVSSLPITRVVWS